ncbi:MAG: hypothetical protein OXI20_15990, partial [Rhodospirillales bacterium]|nr:hypothetical protein [Rhodospirillales bacterium]
MTPRGRAEAGDFAYIDPDEPAAYRWMVAMWADGPGSATLARLIAVESGRSVLRAANPSFPDIAVIRVGEMMMRAVAVFVGPAVRGAAHRHYRSSGPKRPKATSAARRRVGRCGSDGAQNRPCGQSRQGS